jgi:L-seryl-tRNA(Ser) seleniumtransferase
VITFSGDKLLGGPQAGILLGSEAAIAACRADPIARAVRADKLTLAALEATLALYRDPETARREIPVLRMLTEDKRALKSRAEALKNGVGNAAEVIEGESEVGGGSFPGAKLPTWLVAIRYPVPDTLVKRLRRWDPPIITRIADDRVVLDPRTIFPDQVDLVARAVAAALTADG